MRTTKREFKQQVQEHIIERLGTDYYTELKDQLQDTVTQFNDWWGDYEQKHQPNKHEAFKDWLLGLPSQLNIEYCDYNISSSLREWFRNCGEEYKEQGITKERIWYMHLITREFATLCKKNGVEF